MEGKEAGQPSPTEPAAVPSPAASGANEANSANHANPANHDAGDDGDGDDDDASQSRATTAKKTGRRKINIEYIEDKSRRHITFSKRKSGIMKKAYELSTLTGTQVLLLVASETGHVYTFATPKLQPLITKPEGKNLIQACLNVPDQLRPEAGAGYEEPPVYPAEDDGGSKRRKVSESGAGVSVSASGVGGVGAGGGGGGSVGKGGGGGGGGGGGPPPSYTQASLAGLDVPAPYGSMYPMGMYGMNPASLQGPGVGMGMPPGARFGMGGYPMAGGGTQAQFMYPPAGAWGSGGAMAGMAMGGMPGGMPGQGGDGIKDEHQQGNGQQHQQQQQQHLQQQQQHQQQQQQQQQQPGADSSNSNNDGTA